MPPNLLEHSDFGLRLLPDASVRLLEVAGRFALFHEARQQLYELNESAAAIWKSVAGGQLPQIAIDGFALAGLPLEAAADSVHGVLEAWLDHGWLVPADVLATLDSEPIAAFPVRLCGGQFTIKILGSPIDLQSLVAFQHLIGPAPARAELVVVGFESSAYLYAGGYFRGRFQPSTLTPAIKAVLTEQLTQLTTAGFFAHGALLQKNGARLFLSGDPGAGKSTLATGLLTDGFQVHTDDLVHVDEGLMTGVPFAVALKAGSWPLLADKVPKLADHPIFQRSDGQSVIYVPVMQVTSEAAPLNYFVSLDRRSDVHAALEPLEALQALTMTLSGAFSSQKAISAHQISALAGALNACVCFTICYSDIDDARRLLSALV